MLHTVGWNPGSVLPFLLGCLMTHNIGWNGCPGGVLLFLLGCLMTHIGCLQASSLGGTDWLKGQLLLRKPRRCRGTSEWQQLLTMRPCLELPRSRASWLLHVHLKVWLNQRMGLSMMPVTDVFWCLRDGYITSLKEQ